MLIFLVFSALLSTTIGVEDVYCRSLDIRNSPTMAFQDKETNDKWSTLANCTVMEGDFSVSMISSENYTHEDFPVFEHLRVITGHLLVFQVSSLRSLNRMFPSLRVIGGQEMIMNYALVIYQNTHLVEVGLPKLSVIINGGVRVMDNAQLCYSRYIDWSEMLIGPANDILTDQNKASDMGSLCSDECYPPNPEKCHKYDQMLSCWDDRTCQLECKYMWNSDRTVGPGCDDEGDECHRQCLGGCLRPNDPSACHYCRNVNYHGVCIGKCPEGTYEIHHVYLVRRCVTLEECRNISAPITRESNKKQMLIVENMCRVDCPFGQEIDPSNSSRCIKCDGYCPVKCKGGTIDSFARVNDILFKKCNVIQGYLEIELRTGFDSAAIQKVAEALSTIEVIEGYLLIDFSTSFITLRMFKKLRLIKGNILWRDRYALAVFENPNLRQVFDYVKQPLSIGSGTVLFQNNRMLCYRKIIAMINHMGLTDVKENDVSVYSNGDRAICDEINFEVQTDGVHSNGFTITWVAFNTTDMDHRKFLGYQVFYKKVDKPDEAMSIDDSRSACSDSWYMHFEQEKSNGFEGLSRGTGIFNLEPNTWYAYYVQTRLINHPGARNALSKIKFVRTLFATPDPPRNVIGKALLSKPDRIDLSWEPPERPNGDITHYIIKWQILPDNASLISGHVCDEKGPPFVQKRAYNDFVSLASTTPAQPVCLKEAGCCDCSTMKKQQRMQKMEETMYLQELRTAEYADFEDAVQNMVFVQKDESAGKKQRSFRRDSGKERQRLRRHIRMADGFTNVGEVGKPRLQNESAVYVYTSELNESVSIYQAKPGNVMLEINVTTCRLTIIGLKHYTQYQAKVFACQNMSAPGGAYCSQRYGFIVLRTAPIPGNDLVDNSTIEVINSTSEKLDRMSRKLTWQEPPNPNGVILAYRVSVRAEDRPQTPVVQCMTADEFRRQRGLTFIGLAEGRYFAQVETLSVGSLAHHVPTEIAVAHNIFDIRKPTILTWKRIAIATVITFLLLSILSLVSYFVFRKHFGAKVREYVRQQVSANPEYLSQIDVYKSDEWELKREDIHLEEEIGRGTFGKVYRGYGDNVQSVSGVVFGECAVKTVAETANAAERVYFLIEAGVMKLFNTSFIVKLYGVVSDGQPALVVMELMKKGNLRDYLRSRRPEAEENTENLAIPSNSEFIRWASQIADGMAYLEAKKFCHRDLAARNCMVNEHDIVKIGDFGMARDVYYHEYYRPAGKRLMPVRWMAPEALMDGKFSLKSDVWAYGIVIYEMITLAQQPYSGLPNESVFDYIGVKKRTLARPLGCPDFWYDLMMRCWRYDPRDRPTFAQLVMILLRYAEGVLNFRDEEFYELSFVLAVERDGTEDDIDQESTLTNDTTRLVSNSGDVEIRQSEGVSLMQPEERFSEGGYLTSASDCEGFVTFSDENGGVCFSNRRKINENACWLRASPVEVRHHRNNISDLEMPIKMMDGSFTKGRSSKFVRNDEEGHDCL